MFIEKIKMQRIVYLMIGLYALLVAIIIAHDCDANHICKNETAAPQQIIYVVYIVNGDTNEVTETEGVKETVAYYDVPLSEELQDHIIKQCEERGVDPAIIFGMISRESNFNPDAIGDGGNSLGLMQIQPQWHYRRMEEYNCPDLMDPFQNVTVGIDILADWLDGGVSIEHALMGYNGGSAYAEEMLSEGRVSDYAKYVIEYAEGLKEERL